jgi:hypothetical protein
MSRVSTHTVKQASLNLKDMVDKKSIGLDVNDLKDFNHHTVTHWDKEQEKPDTINTMIDQVKSMFDIGKEVIGFSAHYYPPPNYGDKKFSPSEYYIPALKEKMGARFVIMTGSRDICNLSVSTGSIDAESPVLMMSGDCVFMKITIGPVLNITFKNVFGEKLPARKGFRDTVVKKTPQTRHIFVLDAHVAMDDVIHKVKDDLMGMAGIKKDTKINHLTEMVAKMASDKSTDKKSSEEEMPELIPIEKA